MSELMKRRKKVTEPEVRFYILQLTGALRYLHDCNIIHRDLKLGNIFLDGNMRVKVGDFGLAAKLNHTGERRMTLCGTPNYIAPEILQRKHGHSFEVDVWSTGIIVYTLLCGRPPYESKDVDSTYKRILHNHYSFPDHTEVSKEAKNLIQSILQLKPERRLTLQQIESHPFFTNEEFYTPSSLTSAAMREVPPLCQSCYQDSKKLKTGKLDDLLNDENDPTAINRIARPKQNRAGAVRESSPPRKMAHVHPKGSSKAAQSKKKEQGNEERKGKHRTFSGTTRTGFTASAVNVFKNNDNNIPEEVPPPPPSHGLTRGVTGGSCFSERFMLSKQQQETSNRGSYVRQFDIYNDTKQHATASDITSDMCRKRSSSTETPLSIDEPKSISRNLNFKSEKCGTDTYKLESVETFGGEAKMEVDEEVDKLQRSLEQCGIVPEQDSIDDMVEVPCSQSTHESDQEEAPPPPPPVVQPLMSGSFPSKAKEDDIATPLDLISKRRRGSNVAIDTLERMYDTLEHSLINTEKVDFNDDQCEDPKKDDSHALPASLHASAPKVWVVKHVDYTSKYGMGFLMNTGSSGVYFNDSTKIVLSASGKVFQYIERKRRSNGIVEHLCQTHNVDNFPSELNKKFTLLNHFRNYLIDQQSQESKGNSSDQPPLPNIVDDDLLVTRKGVDSVDFEVELPYVKKWVRTRHAILFRLSNKTVQVVFFDKSEILLASEARIVCFVSKEGVRCEYTLESVFRNGRSDIAKRLKYTKDIMSRLINLQQPKGR